MIDEENFTNLLINSTFNPLRANSSAIALPIPSVHPVTTTYVRESKEGKFNRIDPDSVQKYSLVQLPYFLILIPDLRK